MATFLRAMSWPSTRELSGSRMAKLAVCGITSRFASAKMLSMRLEQWLHGKGQWRSSDPAFSRITNVVCDIRDLFAGARI